MLGPLCIVFGVIGFLSSEGGKLRHGGRLLSGLGLMLLSLEMISNTSAPLREAPGLAVILHQSEREPLLDVLLFAVLTWLSHVSLATMLLASSLAKVDTVDGALVIGANLGTAISPLAASSGEPPAARRAHPVSIQDGRSTECINFGNDQ